MKNCKRILLCICSLICIFSAFSYEIHENSSELSEFVIEKRIDKAFSSWQKPGSPGAAIAIIRNGKVFFKKAYGYASIEHDIPITTQTVFNIASLSKQFTAMAIALLAERGDLSLDDEIRTYLPEVPEAYEKITISHLIHHTSGLREFVYVGMKIAGWDNEDKVTHKQILDIKMLVQVTGVTEQAPQFYWERSEIWNQN